MAQANDWRAQLEAFALQRDIASTFRTMTPQGHPRQIKAEAGWFKARPSGEVTTHINTKEARSLKQHRSQRTYPKPTHLPHIKPKHS